MKTIDEAINYAAGRLPDDHKIEITIENGGYNVVLIAPTPDKPRGFYTQHQMSEQSIIDDIIVAADTAHNHID